MYLMTETWGEKSNLQITAVILFWGIRSPLLEKVSSVDHFTSFERYINLLHCTVKIPFRAREALRQCLPDQLKDKTFAPCLKDDTSTIRWKAQLMKNLQETPTTMTDPRGIPMPP